jgi:hypothetical protein
MEYFIGIAFKYAKAYELTDADLSYDNQPDIKEERDWKRHQFQVWARLAMSWAADLAPYQSPTFRAISISHQTDDRVDYRKLASVRCQPRSIQEHIVQSRLARQTRRSQKSEPWWV